MKIREVLDKKVGDKKYTRYIVTLPKDVVEESNLLGKNLSIINEAGRIVIEKKLS